MEDDEIENIQQIIDIKGNVKLCGFGNKTKKKYIIVGTYPDESKFITKERYDEKLLRGEL